MPLPAFAIPLAISAIKALLKYRRRVDDILSIKETTTGLPFLLPYPPSNDKPHWNAMIKFFEDEDGKGQAILLVNNLQDIFIQFAKAVSNRTDPDYSARKSLYRLYCEACGQPLEVSGPDRLKVTIDDGSTPDMLLAYYIISSQRLSRNPTVTRILLATADTLLEVAGQNAGLFISNPKTKVIVETLINEFAVKRDFDDEGSEVVLKALLGSAIIAVADNPGKIAHKPALKPLFSAIGEVRKELGDNFVAEIISHEGFNKLASSYLTHVAKDPSFITNDSFFKEVLKQTIQEWGNKFDDIQKDPKALLGVLEVALTASAANVDGILKRELEGKPLLVTVITAVADEFNKLGTEGKLIKSIGSGNLVPIIYKTVLKTIEANPTLLNDTAKTKTYVGKLLSGLAGALAEYKPKSQTSSELMENIAVRSLNILASQPDLLGENLKFSNEVLKAVFKAGADAGKDGFSDDDILFFVQAALDSATKNIGLIKMNDKYASIIASFGTTLSQHGIRNLLAPTGIRDAISSFLQSVAANPTIWSGLQEKNLVQPLIQAVLSGLATDPTNLLSGSRLTDSLQQILTILAKQGNKLINDKVTHEVINEMLQATLVRAQKEIGISIDGENLPDFIVRVLDAFLQNPFPSDKIVEKAETLLNETLDKMLSTTNVS